MQESILEPVFRKIRFNKVKAYVIGKKKKILDLGTGNGELLEIFKKKNHHVLGVDNDLNLTKENSNILKIDLDKQKLPFKSNSFDFVTCLAVLEHLNYPTEVLKEVLRVLKKDGVVLLTVPTPMSKPVLEILAFKFRLINKEMIVQHKRYFSKRELISLFKSLGFRNIRHGYFELFFNNFIYAKK